MATIVTRAGKGSALTYAEADANFTNLNNAKIETSAIGTSVQPYSANLTEFATVNPTAAGLALLDDADASAQRTTLGLGTAATTSSTDYATAAQGALADTAVQPADIANVLETSDIGVSVQAYDADLTAWAGIATTAKQDTLVSATNIKTINGSSVLGAGNLVVSSTVSDGDKGDITVSASGATWTIDNSVVTTDKLGGDITTAGKALLDDVDASAQRTTLGLGTLATQSGTFSGTTSGTNTGDQNLFSTIVVAGQSNVVADTTSDSLTLVAGSNVTITTDASTDTITIASSGGGSMVYPSGTGIAVVTSGTSWGATLTAPSGAIVGTTDTQTISDKRITPRIGTVASSATITPTGDSSDQYNVTALATAATIAAPSGTPVDGQKLVMRFEDNGTARALTWTTTSGAYRAIGVTLPTTTVITKVIYVGCIYNSADTFWDVVAVAIQA